MPTPLSGSGSKCVAAKLTVRKHIGIEIINVYCKIAAEGLKYVEDNEDKHVLPSLNLSERQIITDQQYILQAILALARTARKASCCSLKTLTYLSLQHQPSPPLPT